LNSYVDDPEEEFDVRIFVIGNKSETLKDDIG
jgi:hypothetical protein